MKALIKVKGVIEKDITLVDWIIIPIHNILNANPEFTDLLTN